MGHLYSRRKTIDDTVELKGNPSFDSSRLLMNDALVLWFNNSRDISFLHNQLNCGLSETKFIPIITSWISQLGRSKMENVVATWIWGWRGGEGEGGEAEVDADERERERETSSHASVNGHQKQLASTHRHRSILVTVEIGNTARQ